MGFVTAKPCEDGLYSLRDAEDIYDFLISRVHFKKGKQAAQDLVGWLTFCHREHFHFQEMFVKESLKLAH